jgi:hypothetical protein
MVRVSYVLKLLLVLIEQAILNRANQFDQTVGVLLSCRQFAELLSRF